MRKEKPHEGRRATKLNRTCRPTDLPTLSYPDAGTRNSRGSDPKFQGPLARIYRAIR